MTMHHTKTCLCAICLVGAASAHTIRQTKSAAPPAPALPIHASLTPPSVDIQPVILSRAAWDDKVVTLHLTPGIATSIRLPEPVNSVVLGDPVNFEAEHSDREAELVTVKPVSPAAAETNLLITTTAGHQANLLLINTGASAGGTRAADVLLQYDKPATDSFLIDETPIVTSVVAETRSLDSVSGSRTATTGLSVSAPSVVHGVGVDADASSAGSTADVLDGLLVRQEKAPIPVLYGQRQTEPKAGQRLKAGVSEVLDEGSQVAVFIFRGEPIRSRDRSPVPADPVRRQVEKEMDDRGAIARHKLPPEHAAARSWPAG